jgi:crossover junction endodeoxyribonuclease RuvC
VIYIGIDPGKKGALAGIDTEAPAPFAVPFSERGYLDVLRDIDPGKSIVALEKVAAMPGQGVTSMFNFGCGFGWIQGILEALRFPYELVPPQRWKKAFGVTSDKHTSIRAAQRLFPGVSLLASPRCRIENDGMAEALLLAEYARRNLGRNTNVKEEQHV